MAIFHIKNIYVYGLALLVSSLSSCYKEQVIEENRPEGWTDESHSDNADLNYEVVFPQDRVNRIDIVVPTDDWNAMLFDLTENIGEFGGQPGPPSDWSLYTPVYGSASVLFNGKEWQHVGVRFKGNSSLRTAWLNGCMKLAFRFDFDQHEDVYPEIHDQRFYGFQKLSFANNFMDDSFLHEKVAADIFRNAGVKAPQTAYYQIFVDYGSGPIYFGLYTAVEIVEDSMLKSQFGSDSGNCYKPEYETATFAYGTYNSYDFYLKNNEETGDYSDVQSLYNTLHSSLRITDVEQWKAELESVFDVDYFLLWLATNTSIQNWDTYGLMSHNYYLYNDPAVNKLRWIPWDNNGALVEGNRIPLSLSMDEVTADWPLIRYLLDQPEYQNIYKTYLEQVINVAFEPTTVIEIYEYYHALIMDYVIGVSGEQPGYTFLNNAQQFTDALTYQIEHVYMRNQAVVDYVTY